MPRCPANATPTPRTGRPTKGLAGAAWLCGRRESVPSRVSPRARVRLTADRGLDVVIEVEDVARVVAVLQRGQPRQRVRAVGAPDARLPLVGEVVDVDAAGERLDRGAVTPRRRHPRLVLRRVGPARHGHELDQRVAVAEGGLVVAERGDRTAIALEAA